MDEDVWISEDEPVETSFATPGYTFYVGCRGVLGTPQEAYLRLVAVNGAERLVLDDIEGLEGLVRIDEPAEALEFVRLFTSLETHYLFPSVTYIEPRRTEDEPGPGEYTDEYARRIGMEPPRSSVREGVFVVERDLLTNTRRLVRVTEHVEPDGAYTLYDTTGIDERSRIEYPVYR